MTSSKDHTIQLEDTNASPMTRATEASVTRSFVDTLGRGPEGTAMSAGPGSLELSSDGSFEAVAGCEALIGRWAERAGRVVLTESSSERRCRARDPQDLDVIASLSEGFTVSIEEDEMTVRGGGRALVYRAASVD